MISEREHWEPITSSQIVREFRHGISVGFDEKRSWQLDNADSTPCPHPFLIGEWCVEKSGSSTRTDG